MVREGAIGSFEATVKPGLVVFVDFSDGDNRIAHNDPLDRVGGDTRLLGTVPYLTFALTEVGFGNVQQTDFVTDLESGAIGHVGAKSGSDHGAGVARQQAGTELLGIGVGVGGHHDDFLAGGLRGHSGCAISL